MSATICRYFARCANVAVGTTTHPVLPPVPTCKRCADRFGLTVTQFPENAPQDVVTFPAAEGWRTLVQWLDPADSLLHERSFYTAAEAAEFVAGGCR